MCIRNRLVKEYGLRKYMYFMKEDRMHRKRIMYERGSIDLGKNLLNGYE